jgi:hypothetical protein
MSGAVSGVCQEHSGHCARLDALESQVGALFKKLDRLFYTAVGLLGAVMVDVVLRIVILAGGK